MSPVELTSVKLPRTVIMPRCLAENSTCVWYGSSCHFAMYALLMSCANGLCASRRSLYVPEAGLKFTHESAARGTRGADRSVHPLARLRPHPHGPAGPIAARPDGLRFSRRRPAGRVMITLQMIN